MIIQNNLKSEDKVCEFFKKLRQIKNDQLQTSNKML